jgi:hypothetical protein
MDKTIRKYTSFDEMKADEYRYWQSRPVYERIRLRFRGASTFSRIFRGLISIRHRSRVEDVIDAIRKAAESQGPPRAKEID